MTRSRIDSRGEEMEMLEDASPIWNKGLMGKFTVIGVVSMSVMLILISSVIEWIADKAKEK